MKFRSVTLFEVLRLFECSKRDEILASKRMQNLPFNRTFLSYPTPPPYIVLPAWIGSYFIVVVHAQSSFYSPLKPRPNDCNISTQSILQYCWVQHVACVWLPCCDVLRHVGCCWLKFENGQIFRATFEDIAWCCSRSARFVQQCFAWACALVRFWTQNMSQHVATVWPNAYNMLRPTMLRSVAFKCCDRLAGACKCWVNNVGMCCVEMLLSFGRGFRLYS